jgi:hypothetical protein
MKAFALALVLLSLAISSQANAFQYAPRASVVVYGLQVAKHVQLNGIRKPVKVVKDDYGVVNEYARKEVKNEYGR